MVENLYGCSIGTKSPYKLFVDCKIKLGICRSIVVVCCSFSFYSRRRHTDRWCNTTPDVRVRSRPPLASPDADLVIGSSVEHSEARHAGPHASQMLSTQRHGSESVAILNPWTLFSSISRLLPTSSRGNTPLGWTCSCSGRTSPCRAMETRDICKNCTQEGLSLIHI